VILDGVARTPDVEQCREVAKQEGARFLTVLTECADLDTHRIRIKSRQRLIPNWYELDWDRVERSRSTWDPSLPADLALQATDSIEANRQILADVIHGLSKLKGVP